ncbi:MAG: nucleotidyltransferase domain-containing protein [Candidatus Omnitrophica bacterium]|nr:nucleotidyltransferase domain-containing protein [Candidatus Omnitrophota bacterium]
MHPLTHSAERNSTGVGGKRQKIQHFLRRSIPRILSRFPQAQKIILFGSYASGHPGRDSDIDLLVITPTNHRWSDRVRMVQALFPERPAPLDIIVRTPREIRQRLTSYFCPFTREILKKGRVLYEASPRRS